MKEFKFEITHQTTPPTPTTTPIIIQPCRLLHHTYILVGLIVGVKGTARILARQLPPAPLYPQRARLIQQRVRTARVIALNELVGALGRRGPGEHTVIKGPPDLRRWPTVHGAVQRQRFVGSDRYAARVGRPGRQIHVDEEQAVRQVDERLVAQRQRAEARGRVVLARGGVDYGRVCWRLDLGAAADPVGFVARGQEGLCHN